MSESNDTKTNKDSWLSSLSSSHQHLSSTLWHGLGLFGESYLLFSVGTLRPLWETLYPACFDPYDNSVCRFPALSFQSITYSVVLGVMVGMIALGAMSNTIGRRRGSIITAAFMAGGSICLTLCSIFLSSWPSVLFPFMSISLFIFGIGVGGEYPLSASSASERALAAMKKRQLNELEHVQKMKRLLSDSSAADNSEVTTPRHGNSKRGGKRESLLHVNTTCAAAITTTNPWQTLQPPTNNSKNEESYGGGVPLSPSNITKETNNSLATYNASLRTRGRDVLLVFSMQGLGVFANSLILTFCLMATKKKNNNGNGGANNGNDDDDAEYNNNNANEAYYEPTTLLNIWRITYAMGAAILIYVLVSRISHLTESEVWAQDRAQREEEMRERHHRDAGPGFSPPRVSMGPYETRMKNEVKKDTKETMAKQQQQRKKEEGRQQEHSPVISPTMSSITMKSEFDLLGSTNLDGCKMVTALGYCHDGGGNGDDEDEDCDSSTNKKPVSDTVLLFQHYGVRLIGTSLTWLLWDIAFYGNKIFQSRFLIALTGEDASLVDISGASAINAFVALLGYYAAASIVDDPDCGRLALQQCGFLITGTLFFLCGNLNDRLSSTWLVIMYFGSSFFGQCGPNCTTFLIPAEIFPTNMRSLCHGISASAGKLGALIAAILFNFVCERDLFLISGYASFAASLITFLTIPETTTLDLYEIDKQ
ncbi:hypothetical protein ACHAXR_005839, partial [Thalassiosira sp. AJA248-18]